MRFICLYSKPAVRITSVLGYINNVALQMEQSLVCLKAPVLLEAFFGIVNYDYIMFLLTAIDNKKLDYFQFFNCDR